MELTDAGLIATPIVDAIKDKIDELSLLGDSDLVSAINEIKLALHEVSPLKSEPVDCVLWVKAERVEANDYNPNAVAPPEMRLLETSIIEDGYTQPIVTFDDNGRIEVVDGFHRNRVGRECKPVRKRVKGYLPVTTINRHRAGRGDRIAATIRHNRARGKHKIEAMSEIVIELKGRNWSNERIGRELGMDQDEILRLCQITGLAELFSDSEFSRSWDAEGEVEEGDFEELSDDVERYGEEATLFRTVNTSDPDRIFHTFDKWECHAAGFYESSLDGVPKDDGRELYRQFLSDEKRFRAALVGVITEWKHSCEHYLTNTAMNRVAWLGQASACYEAGLPAAYCGGFHLLSKEQQAAANQMALDALNEWLTSRGREEVTMTEATSGERQSEIY